MLAVFREPVGRSWELLFAEGPQLPWYRVLTLTSNPDNPWLGTWWLPTLRHWNDNGCLCGHLAIRWPTGDDTWRSVIAALGGLVSLVVPVFNEVQVLAAFYDRATNALAALDGMTYEIVFVDDGSQDGSFAKLAAFAKSNPRIRVLKLSQELRTPDCDQRGNRSRQRRLRGDHRRGPAGSARSGG